MNYRLLPPDEWRKLTDLIPAKYLPAPEAATAAVAEDEEGNVQAVLLLQLQLHMEPLLIRSPEVNFKRLQQVLHNAVAPGQPGLCYFAFTDDPKIARMAELVGMELTPYQVWRKEIA